MNEFAAQRNLRLVRVLEDRSRHVREYDTMVVEGTLKRVVGLTLEAAGLSVQIGGRCRIDAADHSSIEAEVVGFSGDRTYLMPAGEMQGLLPNARVVPLTRRPEFPVGDGLLGRVLDSEGAPLDGLGRLKNVTRKSLRSTSINPLLREPIREPLDVGVRAINTLLTVGRGQRLGLFAGTGVGKSTLLGMMTRYTRAEVVVVGLVGERGREVRDFIERNLGPEGLKRAVIVATPADRPPLQRMRGAWLATSVAEAFRDQGRHVLLLMDSLSRFAQAAREIGLAVGEPPTTRGYPPSVFAKLPALVERAGNGMPGGGSITAVYTVLTEGDDPNDPIADTARGILDGHIVLSRSVADAGLYPAIDIEASVSRVANDIVPATQQQQARRFRQLYSAYRQNRDLIAIGAYQKGADPRVDAAIAAWPSMETFLQQSASAGASYAESCAALAALASAATPSR
ncbi:flagellar protein export ATPase FliI [Panacagrimonas sp.]|uniref:flagellar protein export ATPase FliI n=1 Tax=Panacagrimonas sp. TaxID=2480088 RepID=UPI003B51B359